MNYAAWSSMLSCHATETEPITLPHKEGNLMPMFSWHVNHACVIHIIKHFLVHMQFPVHKYGQHEYVMYNVICLHDYIYWTYCRAANLWNIISVFCWKNFRILSNFSVSLNLFLTRLKTFIRQLPIYSGGTHPLPVETLVDSFGTTGTGSEARKRATTTCGREKIECFGD